MLTPFFSSIKLSGAKALKVPSNISLLSSRHAQITSIARGDWAVDVHAVINFGT